MTRLPLFLLRFLILMAVVCPQPASAAMGVQLETRVGGIELVVHALVGGSSARSPEKHLGSSPAYDEIAPGYSLAAEGLGAGAQTLSREASMWEGLGQLSHGGGISADTALESGAKWVGEGYKEVAPGVFRSSDGLRQFRMMTEDLVGAHGDIGPHVHFESLNPLGRVIENNHVPLLPDVPGAP